MTHGTAGPALAGPVPAAAQTRWARVPGSSRPACRAPVEAKDISDVLERWKQRNPGRDTDRNAKAFFVPAAEIRENMDDLSISRHREIEYEEVKYDPPYKILDQLEALEAEITADLKEPRGML